MKAFFIGLILGTLTALVANAGILATSRGGTGANITPVAGQFVISTNSGFALSSTVPSGATLIVPSGTTVAYTYFVGNKNLISIGQTVAEMASGVTNQILQSGGTLAAPFYSSSLLIPSGGTIVLQPSVSTVGGAPLTIPAGSTLITPQKGSIESNGVDLYWTDSTGTRYKLNKTLTN